jgi:type I restriction enzyme S subunit
MKGNEETGETLLQRLLAARRARWEASELQRFGAAGKEPKDDRWKLRYREPAQPKTAGLPKMPKQWSWTNLDQLKAYSIYGPRFSRDDYETDGVAVLRTTDIDENGRVSLETCPKLPLSDEEYEKYKVEAGDLLITRTGSIGTLAIFKDTVKAIPGAYLLHYRLVDPAIVEFVYTFLRSPDAQEQLWRESAGSGRQNLSAPGLESIAIPLPPLGEQNEIVREVNRRLSAAERLSTVLKQQIARARSMRELLLAQAFTGQMETQDPKDEHASILLDRIRAARKAEAQKPKAKRMLKSKSKSKGPRRTLLATLREHTSPITPEQLFREAGFDASQVDLFYRELTSLRDKLIEQKPKAADAKLWPRRASVMLLLKED